MAIYKDAEPNDYTIKNGTQTLNTIEFLGIWEQQNTPGFKPMDFDGYRKQAGLNSFSLTASRWIEATNAIGLMGKWLRLKREGSARCHYR